MSKKKVDADVIIVGAGPAGLSAATWCVELGLNTVVFEKESEPGGQLIRIYNPVTNYLGLEAANGRELRDIFMRSFAKKETVMWLSAEIVDIDPATQSVTANGGLRLTAHSLIIATGVRRRKLNVPGEDKFIGKGVIDSGSKEKEKAKDKKVLIAGGGDAALENALILADYASKVYVAHRRSEFKARDGFIELAANHPNIEFRFESVINSISGGTKLESVELADNVTGKIESLKVDIVLSRIGVEPNTALLRNKIELDPNGYILVNVNCETSAPGTYAIGDAANPTAPTISTATGMGATAAKNVKAELSKAMESD